MAETQTGKRVKTLRSDNGGEYTSGAMAKFCKDRGIEQKFTPPYTPQLNGSGGTDESDAGGVCSLYAGARRVVQVVLGAKR
ncbi:hypothetical protein Pcac1_g29249 [Phytophthora cactorum]|nr:hypothetical protein Pcac1_g29249 [Phytophthora cactorum]